MSDDEARVPPEEPAEPILLPENPYASPREPGEPPAGGDAAPGVPIEPVKRPRVWTVFVVFVGAVVANFAVVIVLLILLTVWRHGPEGLSPPRIGGAVVEVSESLVGLLVTVLGTMIVFAVAAIGAAALSPVEWRQRLRFRPAKLSIGGMLVHVCGVVAIGIVFGALVALEVLPHSPALSSLTEIVAGLRGASLAAMVLVIGIAPGIAEELLFRGYVQTRFSRRWGPGWAVLWTSLLFGVMHLDPIHAVFAFGLGIYLGYLTEWTGSLVPAMICHAANNTFSTVITAYGFEIVGVTANLVALVLGLLLLMVSIWHLRAHVRPKEEATG